MNPFDSIFSTLFPFVDFVYIAQLEDYDIVQYWRWISSGIFKRHLQKVAKINWTPKAKIILGLSLLLYAVPIILSPFIFINALWLLFVVLVLTIAIPLLVALALVLFLPVDTYMKNLTIKKAKARLGNMVKAGDLKVVAIAGSYGKTSTRYFAYDLVKDSFKTHTPIENHNTLYSIALDIVHNLDTSTEVYITEIGEQHPGDITSIMSLLKPSIAVLTGVGSQHIAQMGSQKLIDDEFVTFINKSEAEIKLINGQDDGIKRLRERFNKDVREVPVTKNPVPVALKDIVHMAENVAAAEAIASALKISDQTITDRVKSLAAVQRRMKISHNNDVTIIDDSYNISPESTAAALDHLSTYKNRKVVVTGGIVDQGDNQAEANIAFGERLADVADVIVIADNILAKYIQQGIKKSGKKVEIHISEHPSKTPDILKDILKSGDVVLVQNELPDTYWS